MIDAKYKELGSDGPPSGDLYQLLAYCTAYGLRTGHLVYAAASSPVRSGYLVRNSDVMLRIHVLDLNQLPSALLEEAQTLAEALRDEAKAR